VKDNFLYYTKIKKFQLNSQHAQQTFKPVKLHYLPNKRNPQYLQRGCSGWGG